MDPTETSAMEYSSSLRVAAPLIHLILAQDPRYPFEALEEQIMAKTEIRREKSEQQSEAAKLLKSTLSRSLQRAVDLAQEKGASSWLTVLPLMDMGFCLHKSAFRGALALRYGWPSLLTPSHCACGTHFSVDHALSCPKGGFPSIRHNEIHDLTANLLSEVCSDVSIEPDLQPLTGEGFALSTTNTQDNARLDIAASGFWGGRFELTYFDVRVFNPYAPMNQHGRLSTCYRKHELIKKRAYEQRIHDIEHASFTPLVMSSTGGLGSAATITYKRLASSLASKWDQTYSDTMSWLRCRISSLLRSSIQAIRGARSSTGHAARAPRLMTAESQISISN